MFGYLKSTSGLNEKYKNLQEYVIALLLFNKYEINHKYFRPLYFEEQ